MADNGIKPGLHLAAFGQERGELRVARLNPSAFSHSRARDLPGVFAGKTKNSQRYQC
jgi:hypothetical protein